jgi:hypothetical protein
LPGFEAAGLLGVVTAPTDFVTGFETTVGLGVVGLGVVGFSATVFSVAVFSVTAGFDEALVTVAGFLP